MIDNDKKLDLYRIMYECRVLEKRAYDLFMQNLIKGTSHLSIGQEAVAAGFGAAMRSDDYTFCTYRGHNHTYVRGTSMTSAATRDRPLKSSLSHHVWLEVLIWCGAPMVSSKN